jgi:hypothetical protein
MYFLKFLSCETARATSCVLPCKAPDRGEYRNFDIPTTGFMLGDTGTEDAPEWALEQEDA